MSHDSMASCTPGEPGYDYDAAHDAETLTQAHAIRSDPQRHATAKQHAAKKIAAMKTVVRSKPLGSKR